MSDEKMVSEREAVLRERAAFCEGARRQEVRHRASVRCQETVNLATIQGEAAELYKLPKVKRPRVVTDSTGVRWRVLDGHIEWRWRNFDDWRVASDQTGERMFITDERIPLLADLLATPFEEVDDDGGAR